MARKARQAGRSGAVLRAVLNASAGAGTVLAAAYAFTRAKHGRDRQERLERLEAMVAQLTSERGAGKG